ncbi:MAG: collagen-like protein [Labilibaculum sp.]|nr:collagen-like protein [Labilibaculum sp.]
MNLNLKKVRTRILLVVFFSSLLIISCEKDDEFVQPDAKTQNQEFFKQQKCSETFFRSSKTKSTDDFTIQIINYLKYIDDRTHFTEEFVETYGRPWWDICNTTPTQYTPMKIVPIIDVDEIHISGLLFFGFRDNEFVSFFILNDECAIRTLKNEQMRTLYSNLILNYERVLSKLSKQRLKVVHVIGQGDCYSTYVDELWIKTECKMKLIDWTPTGPGPTGLPDGPMGPGEPDGPGNPGDPLGPIEPLGPGGGGGGGNPKCKYINGEWVCPIKVPEEIIPSPEPINNLTSEKIQQRLCEIYNGAINLSELEQNKDNFSPAQEQFVISLANIAAMSKLKLPLNNLKDDLKVFPINSALYSKYSILNNHIKYTSSWTRVYNSSPNSDYALLSPKIVNTNFQLKYYPEKNGQYNALGLVKEGLIDHSIETAIELLEVLGKNAGLPDDFLYDMHLYNALNFMEDYCNE